MKLTPGVARVFSSQVKLTNEFLARATIFDPLINFAEDK